MSITFEDTWRAVLAHCSLAGTMLCREWAQWAYNEFGQQRNWSHLRVESVIVVNDQKTGNCTVTKGSASVTGGALAFVATDVGRQFRLSSIPIYTIIAVAGGVATLDRVYQEASGLVSATVLDAYTTVPADFAKFYAVLDPANKWRLRWWISTDYLNQYDPGRMSVGTARMLCNQNFSPVPADYGKPRFELYPYQTSARAYPMWYFRKGQVLTDDEVLIGPLVNRGKDVLVKGALSRAALWPGMEGRKNPYFSLELAKFHEGEFRKALSELKVEDDDLYFEDCPVVQFAYADFPWDAAWLQSHEPATIG